MSDFDFIPDVPLRSNIILTNEYNLKLVILSESKEYKKQTSLVSSIRKTVIINTATIVEALLLWKIKSKYTSKEIVFDDEWTYIDPKTIYKIPDSIEEIVWCRRKKVTKKIDRLDFLTIIRACIKFQILKEDKLGNDIDKIRQLRNALHIGGLTEIDREYKVEDLEFCFSVLDRVKELVSKE